MITALEELAERFNGAAWGGATVAMTCYVLIRILQSEDESLLRRFHVLVRDFIEREQERDQLVARED